MLQNRLSTTLYTTLGLATAYGLVYLFARLTHRLVYYGAFVARPHATHGLGFTVWEIVFMPLTAMEPWVREMLI